MTQSQGLVKGFHGVRYQVSDVARAAAFYTERLGFKLEMQKLPAFANVSLGALQILLSGPGASGSRAMARAPSSAPLRSGATAATSSQRMRRAERAATTPR